MNGSLMLLEVSPHNISTIFGFSYEGRGLKSTDGGETWGNMFSFWEPWPNNRRVRKIYVSPFNENIIFSIITNSSWASLVRTTDGGGTWEDVSAFASSSHGSQITFAFDPVDSATIYVAGDDQMAHTAFYPSYDLGESWYFLPNSISTQRILVDWNNNKRIYVFIFPKRSEDGGGTWQSINEGISADSYWTSIIDPYDSAVLYMSTNLGVYKTTNMGEYWKLMDGSESLELGFLSDKQFDNLFIDSSTNKLYVGTNKGLYKYDLLTSVEEKEDIPNEFILHQNYPNPFNPSTMISFSVPTSANVAVNVFDLLGREVQTLINKNLSPGNYEVGFDASNLPSGVYFYKLTAGSFVETKKMLLLR